MRLTLLERKKLEKIKGDIFMEYPKMKNIFIFMVRREYNIFLFKYINKPISIFYLILCEFIFINYCGINIYFKSKYIDMIG